MCGITHSLQSTTNKKKTHTLSQISKIQHQKTQSIGIISQEEFEDNKGIIRICKSKNRQNNGQEKKYKRTNNINKTYI